MDAQLMDAMALNNFPVVVAMHSQSLEEPSSDGQRYIVGRKGLYREVATPWLLSRALIAEAPMPTPYGEVTEVAALKCGSPPADLWRLFIDHAKKESPLECAALMIWHTGIQSWRLAIRDVSFATSDRVDYLEPELLEDEIAVVDVHSHGLHPAFFSSRDDRDDLGGIKISAVIGRLDLDSPEVAIRLVCIDSVRKVTMERAQLTVMSEMK